MNTCIIVKSKLLQVQQKLHFKHLQLKGHNWYRKLAKNKLVNKLAFTCQNLGRYFESKVVNHNPQDKGYKGL